ncbi:hypothetical protein F4803DRAFT_526343 [Xylaria telfairii]|nr:hypothetical protein F4803DRAFT_526343 [Xylaria telfairii]
MEFDTRLTTAQILEPSQGASDEGLTPLGCAVLVSADSMDHANLEQLDLLLRYGADPNVPTSNGVTPIFIAIHQRNVGAFKALLDAGADLQHACKSGQTAEEYALETGFYTPQRLNSEYYISFTKPARPSTPFLDDIQYHVNRGKKQTAGL